MGGKRELDPVSIVRKILVIFEVSLYFRHATTGNTAVLELSFEYYFHREPSFNQKSQSSPVARLVWDAQASEIPLGIDGDDGQRIQAVKDT